MLKCYTSPKYKNRTNNPKYYYYRGYTNNLLRRYLEHKKCNNKKAYTARFKGNVQVVYVELIIDRTNRLERKRARKREKQIKKWSRKVIEKKININAKKMAEIIDKYLNETLDY